MLPVGATDTMLNIQVTGYNYEQGSAWELLLGGYLSTANGEWHPPSVTAVLTSGSVKPISKVEYGFDTVAGKMCILLYPAAHWLNPNIVVEQVIGSWKFYDKVPLEGWTISQIANTTGITVSETITDLSPGGIDTYVNVNIEQLRAEFYTVLVDAGTLTIGDVPDEIRESVSLALEADGDKK